MLHQVGYRRRRTGTRSILHRASISRDGRPLRRPGRGPGLEERVRRRRVGPRAHDPVAHAGLRLPRRDPLRRRHAWPTSRATPWVVPNAICMHEEDFGIGWKHVDLLTGHHEVRRSRRLVISHIATVGQLRVRVLLVPVPRRQHPARGEAHRHHVAPRACRPGETDPRTPRSWPRAWPRRCTSTCSAPGSTSTSTGPTNRVEEVEAEVAAGRARQPVGQRLPGPAPRCCERESAAQREVEPGDQPVVAGHQPERCATGWTSRSATSWCPPCRTPTLLARPESSVAQRAGFARHNLWVTPYAPDERRAAGDFPNQHAGGAGLPGVDRGRPGPRRHRRGALVHVRRHPPPPARGLAGHAGGVHGLPAHPVRLLRPQPGARRAALEPADHCAHEP